MCKRLGAGHIPMPRAALLDLQRFANRYVKENYRPLAPDEVPSIRAWLAGSNYTATRVSELLETARRRGLDVDDNGVGRLDHARSARINSFVKAEFYKAYKAPRLICSRSDYAKCIYGPISSAIERVVYGTDHHFIKHVPIPDRPKYIGSLGLEGKVVVESDYSSFESHFTSDIMHALELVLYRHMLQNIRNYCGLDLSTDSGFEQLFAPITSTNRIRLLDSDYLIHATRMSGEMFTSLGNGFSNLIISLWMFDRCGVSGVDGVVEGDDGLFLVPAKFAEQIPKPDDFASMGFAVKLDVKPSVNRASFCGMVFAVETEHILRDPIWTLGRLGWVFRRVVNSRGKAMGLCKAKLLSMLYECHGCPILGPCAIRGIALLKGVRPDWSQDDHRWDPNWASRLLRLEQLDCERLSMPRIEDRRLFAEHFLVSIEEQLRIEQEIAECTDIGRLLSGSALRGMFERLADQSWRDTWEERVFHAIPGMSLELCTQPERVNEPLITDPVFISFSKGLDTNRLPETGG